MACLSAIFGVYGIVITIRLVKTNRRYNNLVKKHGIATVHGRKVKQRSKREYDSVSAGGGSLGNYDYEDHDDRGGDAASTGGGGGGSTGGGGGGSTG